MKCRYSKLLGNVAISFQFDQKYLTYQTLYPWESIDSSITGLTLRHRDTIQFAAASGEFMKRRPEECYDLIENMESTAHQKMIGVILCSTGMRVINQCWQFQATPPPASVKAVEEVCVTCGGAHPYYQCLAADGNTFPEYQDNIQGYVTAAAAPIQQNQSVPLNELGKIKKINDINIKAMQTQINNVKNELRSEMQNSIQTSLSKQTNELKNMMASFFQMNTASTSGTRSLPSNTVANPKGELKAITTRSGHVIDGPSVLIPPPFINSEEDERVEETLTDPEHGEFTIKVPPPLV
ncbi:hypothetical protein Tco_1410234 [Tanacetum coccineum]